MEDRINLVRRGVKKMEGPNIFELRVSVLRMGFMRVVGPVYYKSAITAGPVLSNEEN
jgi:hypothetical protein